MKVAASTAKMVAVANKPLQGGEGRKNLHSTRRPKEHKVPENLTSAIKGPDRGNG